MVSAADADDRGATTFNAPPSRSHSSISHVRNESKRRASAARTSKRDAQPSIGRHPYLFGRVGGREAARGVQCSGAAQVQQQALGSRDAGPDRSYRYM